MPCGQKAKISYGSKIIINLIKALKTVHVKKKKKKRKSLKKMIPSCPWTLKVKVSEHWHDGVMRAGLC